MCYIKGSYCIRQNCLCTHNYTITPLASFKDPIVLRATYCITTLIKNPNNDTNNNFLIKISPLNTRSGHDQIMWQVFGNRKSDKENTLNSESAHSLRHTDNIGTTPHS